MRFLYPVALGVYIYFLVDHLFPNRPPNRVLLWHWANEGTAIAVESLMRFRELALSEYNRAVEETRM